MPGPEEAAIISAAPTPEKLILGSQRYVIHCPISFKYMVRRGIVVPDFERFNQGKH
jgi:hypothetical protein